MKFLKIIFSSFLILGSVTSLCASAGTQKPAEKSLLTKAKEKVFGQKNEAPVGQEIRPMTPEEIAALTPKPKEPGKLDVFGKKVGSSVAEYVVDKIIPGYKQDLSVISKVSDVLAESAENLKKKSVELKKAFPHPDFKEAARILPEMFRDFKQFAGVNIMLGQIQTMLNKVRNSLKDNAEAVQAIDETIKAIDKTKEGLSYVWDLPNGIANSLREIAQQIELMFTVETRSRSSSVSLQPAG